MSLATRCPSCGTVFRVVQDQLRVSEGWVRCGRCNGVFDAAEVLFDIDSGAAVQFGLGLRGAAATSPDAEAPDFSAPVADAGAAPAAPPPAAWPHPPPPPPPLSTSPRPVDQRQEPRFDVGPSWAAPGPAEPAWSPSGGPRSQADFSLREEPLLRAPSRHADEVDDGGQRDAADDPIIITDHVPGEAPPAAVVDLRPPALIAAGTAAVAATPYADSASAVQPLPSFLRTADRSARWRHPAVRAALGVGVLLLALGLLAQAALLWRDVLAARVPATAPLLQGLCRLAGCSVQPLRRIESLTVGSSGLNRLEGSTVYRLQVVLHNRADTAVMMPALDLSLTDGAGQLVSRRVLQVAELGAPQPVLQAGEELPIKVLVSTGELRIDGYTLALFYP